MPELQQPDIVGNFLSSYATAQAQQQAQQDREFNKQRMAKQDGMAEQQFKMQQQRHQFDIAQQVVDMLGGVQDGDAAGFERAKQRWGQMGLPMEAVAGYTVADLPALRIKAGTQLRELQAKAQEANIRQSNAAAAQSRAAAAALRTRGGGLGGAPGGKAPPEWAAKDAMWIKRGTEANNQFSPEITKALTSNTKDWIARGVGEWNAGIGNVAQSKESRQASQVAKNFVAVVLRKDTGAAVTPQEFDFYKDIFIPQYGDDEGTLQLKATARNTFLQALGAGLSSYQALQTMNIRPPEGLAPQESDASATDMSAAGQSDAGGEVTWTFDAQGNLVPAK